ncbi:hypothetical protein ACWGHM_41505 [Streptomyces sp. NPDC054904]
MARSIRARRNAQDARRRRRSELKEAVVASLSASRQNVASKLVQALGDLALGDSVPAAYWRAARAGDFPRENRAYLAQFVGPGGASFVKVGRVGRMRRPAPAGRWWDRIDELRAEARPYGHALVDVWVSPPVVSPERLEAAMLVAIEAEVRYRPVKREYFQSLDFAVGLNTVMALPEWESEEKIHLILPYQGVAVEVSGNVWGDSAPTRDDPDPGPVRGPVGELLDGTAATPPPSCSR